MTFSKSLTRRSPLFLVFTIVAVGGGYRNEFIVQLYVMPKDGYPPILMPTLGPKKVNFLEGSFKGCQ
jgi:hypothetical protein